MVKVRGWEIFPCSGDTENALEVGPGSVSAFLVSDITALVEVTRFSGSSLSAGTLVSLLCFAMGLRLQRLLFVLLVLVLILAFLS